MADDAVRIEGLAQFRRALREIDPELQKELRNEFLPVAEKVAADARTRVPSRSGTAAGSLRGGVSGNNAYVAGGRRTVPYFGWLDFGSRSPNLGNPRSYGPWFKSGTGPARGRFIYPAIDNQRAEIVQAAAKAINNVTEKVFE